MAKPKLSHCPIQCLGNDFAGNAMVALSSELTDALREYDSKIGKVNELIVGLRKIVENSAVTEVRLVTSGLVDLDSLVNKGDMLSDYAESLALIKKFKTNLNDFANMLK